jgi:arylsulfatase
MIKLNLIKRSAILFSVIILPLVFLCQCGSEKDQLPNIIIIFTDDQGYSDVGVFGARGFTTPNLDRLASEGMRFTNFYVSQAVCSASRASLMTGCYAERVGIQGALNSWSQFGLNPDEETIAEILKQKDYATGIFGKWHLGHHKEFLPLQQGFDEYLGLPYSNDMWPVDYDGKPITKANPGSNPWKSRYPPLPLIDGDNKISEINTLNDQATLTTLYTKRAVDFIERHKDDPFFLYLPHSMPHVPLGVSDKFKGKSRQGMYGDVIMEIDWSVGEIIKTLKRLDLEKNTLVIYASDNGPWLNYGNHAGSAFPLREGKGTMWEGGARVPCIMRWPGVIPAGTTCKQLAATIDILPTIAAITQSDLPSKRIDGINVLPLLEGKVKKAVRDHYFYYYAGELIAVRQGNWKLVFPHKYRSYQEVEPGMNGYPGPYNYGISGLELYDLDKDISESTNLAADHPRIVKDLTTLAQGAREELGDMLTGVRGKGVREPGRIGKPLKQKIQHIGKGKTILLTFPYHVKYSGGGNDALVNGVKGTADYTDGRWQGYEGVNLEAVLDLGTNRDVTYIDCGFLENQMAWIFFPSDIVYEISEDGKHFHRIKQFETEVAPRPQATVKSFSVELDKPHSARYIRVWAKNVGICPDWHHGAGGKAWIFADEIVIK